MSRRYEERISGEQLKPFLSNGLLIPVMFLEERGCNRLSVSCILYIEKAAESGARTLICGDIDPRSFVAAELSNMNVGVSPMISARKAIELASKRQLVIATTPTIRDRSNLS